MSTKCVVNKSTMTGIADAIRAKGGTTDALLPSQMAEAIEELPDKLARIMSLDQDVNSWEGEMSRIPDYFASLGDNTEKYGLVEITARGCARVGKYAFHHCRNLKNFVFDDVEAIDERAFDATKVMTDGCIAPKCKSIGNYSFHYGVFGGDIDLPECVTLGREAFGYSIVSRNIVVNIPKAASIGVGAFVRSSGSGAKEIRITNKTANEILGMVNFPFGSPSVDIFVGSNADVKYVDGAWVVVERS